MNATVPAGTVCKIISVTWLYWALPRMGDTLEISDTQDGTQSPSQCCPIDCGFPRTPWSSWQRNLGWVAPHSRAPDHSDGRGLFSVPQISVPRVARTPAREVQQSHPLRLCVVAGNPDFLAATLTTLSDSEQPNLALRCPGATQGSLGGARSCLRAFVLGGRFLHCSRLTISITVFLLGPTLPPINR
jgi:hypothetical protein